MTTSASRPTYEYLSVSFNVNTLEFQAMDEELNDYGAAGWRIVHSHVDSGRLFILMCHTLYPAKPERIRPASR